MNKLKIVNKSDIVSQMTNVINETWKDYKYILKEAGIKKKREIIDNTCEINGDDYENVQWEMGYLHALAWVIGLKD